MSTVSIGTLKGYLLLEDTLTPALTRASAKLTTTGKRLNELGQQTSAAGRAMLPLSAAVGALGLGAVTMARDFNAGMANVATLIPGNTQRVKELKGSVQDMAVAVGKSTTDLTDGLYQVVSAFGDTTDTVKILDINARAATAGLATTTDAINFTSAVTKAYGDTSAEAVQQASDLAFIVTKLGQTTFPELSASIGNVAPFAATLNVRQEELAAAFATLTGVTGNAAMVSTQLRAVLASMLKPTTEMEAAIAGLEYASASAMIQELGMVGAMQALIAKTDGSKQAIGELFGQVEGLNAVFALTGGQADTFATKMAATNQVSGASAEAFREQTQGVNAAGFAWNQFKQEVVTTAQRFGDDLIPHLQRAGEVMRPLWDAVTWGVDVFGRLPAALQTTGVALGVLMVAAAPVLIGLGTLISLAGLTVTSLGTLSGALAGTTTAMAAAGTAAPAAAAGVGLLGGSLRALTLAAGPVGIAITGMWAAWKVFQWATARKEVASVEARIASLSERIANISDTGARATRMKQHLTAALRDEEAALTAANAAAAAAVRNAPAEIARLEAEIEALPTLSRNYDNLVRAKQREIAENRQLLADREEQVTAIREEAAAIEASQQAIWDAAVASMRATKTNDDFTASMEGSTAAVDALDTSVDRFTGGTLNSRNALMGFIGTLQPLPQLGIEAAMAVDALDTSFDRFTGGTSNSRNALMGFIGTLQDLPAAATPAGTAAADGFLSGMGESFAGFGQQIGQTFARALEGGGGFLGATQSLGVQAGDRLGTSLSEGLSTKMAAKTGFLATGLGKVLGDAAGMAIPLIGPVIGSLVGKLFSLGGPSEAELAGRQVAGRFRQGLLAELNPAQMAEVQQAIQGAWKGNEIGAATVIAIRDAYIAAGASAEDALNVVNRLWQAEQQGGAAVQQVIDEITQTIATEVTPTVEASGEAFEEVTAAGRGAFAELTGTIDIMQAKIANTDSLDRMAAEFRKASEGSTYNLGTILREAESLTDSLGSTHPAVVQMQGLIRDASETGVWDFAQMALAIGAMKDEMATPIVIPVTPVLTGMIDPGREGNDRLSPSNFSTREAWEANWLARNPGDAHRADEALGGHQFAAGTGGLRQFSPFGTPAWLHGEEEVLTRQQGQGVATMVGAQLENARAQFAVASRHMETAGAGMAGAAGLGAPIVVHLHTHIDGRRAAEAVVRRIPGVLAVHGVA